MGTEIFPYTPTSLPWNPTYEQVHDAVDTWSATVSKQARDSCKTRRAWGTLFEDLTTAMQGLNDSDDETRASFHKLASELWTKYKESYQDERMQRGLQEYVDKSYSVTTDLYDIYKPFSGSKIPPDLQPLRTAVEATEAVVQSTREELEVQLKIEEHAHAMKLERGEYKIAVSEAYRKHLRDAPSRLDGRTKMVTLMRENLHALEEEARELRAEARGSRHGRLAQFGRDLREHLPFGTRGPKADRAG